MLLVLRFLFLILFLLLCFFCYFFLFFVFVVVLIFVFDLVLLVLIVFLVLFFLFCFCSCSCFFVEFCFLFCFFFFVFIFVFLVGCSSWTSHWYTKMCTIFLPDFKKCACLFRGLKKKKKVSGPPWPPIVINLIFSSIDSIGHFCHALMHAQHAKYDLERPRLTTWVASQHM